MTALARNTDPDTSHEAAAAVDSEKLVEQIFTVLLYHGEHTAPEIARKLDLWAPSVTPRMKPMREQGLIERTGEKRNGAYVHKIVELEP